jgi:hypothetical protein
MKWLNVTSSADHIKVIANNIADIWEGVVVILAVVLLWKRA